jgi:hypothetical protein
MLPDFRSTWPIRHHRYTACFYPSLKASSLSISEGANGDHQGNEVAQGAVGTLLKLYFYLQQSVQMQCKSQFGTSVSFSRRKRE